jgi:hypothetical protein
MAEYITGGTVDDDAIRHKLGCIVLDYTNWGADADDQDAALGGASMLDGSVAAHNTPDIALETGEEVDWHIDMGRFWDADLREDMQAEVIYYSAAGSMTDGDLTVSIKGFASGVALSDIATSADGSAAWTDLTGTVADAQYSTGKKPLGCAGAFATFTDTTNPRKRVTQDLSVGVRLDCVLESDVAANDLRIKAVRIWYVREICHWSGARQRM